MATDKPSRKELQAEIEALRFRLEEAEAVIQAIQGGEVDAIVVSSASGESQVFTLQGAEHPYRVLMETMSEGAAFLSPDGMIAYCNRRLADLLQVPMEKLIGSPFVDSVAPQAQALVVERLKNPKFQDSRVEIAMKAEKGCDAVDLPVLFSYTAVDLAGKAGASIIITDLSERKQQESRLLEAERRIAAATERERAEQELLASKAARGCFGEYE